MTDHRDPSQSDAAGEAHWTAQPHPGTGAYPVSHETDTSPGVADRTITQTNNRRIITDRTAAWGANYTRHSDQPGKHAASPATTVDQATGLFEPARPAPSRQVAPKRQSTRILRPENLLDAPHDKYAVLARGLAVVGSEGPVYGPIDVAVPATGVTVLSGRGGSGRTALALTIAGRMKPSKGDLIVLGMTKRRDIRRHVAIAGVDQIDLLDRDLTVRQVLSEHRCWGRGFYKPPLRIDEDYLTEIAEPIYGTRTLPPLDAYISQLPGLDRHLLRIAMALHPAHHEPVGLLVVDDLEQIHELDERVVLVSRLVELSQHLPVVINAVNFLPHTLVPPERQVRLDADAAHISPYDWGIEDDELDQIVKEYAK